VLRNTLLQSLEWEDLRALHPFLGGVTLLDQSVLHEIGRPFDGVYFIESGVVSLLSGTSRYMVQTAAISHKGVVGSTLVSGSDIAFHQATVLFSGSASRITTSELLRFIALGHPIEQILLSSTMDLLARGCQTALCAVAHNAEQRIACWLLEAVDALDSAALHMTHTRLANLLGLRRAGLTEVLRRFESDGLIRKSRGHIFVRSSERLQSVACDCYQRINWTPTIREYDQKSVLQCR